MRPMALILSFIPPTSKSGACFPLAEMAAALPDLEKVRNVKCIYQPFLRQSRIAALPCFSHKDADYEISQVGTGSTNYKIKQASKRVRTVHEEKIAGKTVRFIRPKEKAVKEIIADAEEFEIFVDTPAIGADEEYNFVLKGNARIIQDKFDDSFLQVKDLG